jgi:ribosomal protein S18 acetylase RimI-like enzyme
VDEQPPTPHVIIRAATADDLSSLEHHLHRGFPQRHRPRFDLQAAGKATYLIVWLDDVPIGHAMIEWAWEHEHDDPMALLLRGQPCLMDVYIVEEQRSRGIGSRLLAHIDDLVQERGHALIGLGVATDNPRARALYERHDYRDAGIGEFTSGWYELDEHGQERWVEERETCMIKRYR